MLIRSLINVEVTLTADSFFNQLYCIFYSFVKFNMCFIFFMQELCVGIVGLSADVTHDSVAAYPGSDVCVKRPAKSAKTETP